MSRIAVIVGIVALVAAHVIVLGLVGLIIARLRGRGRGEPKASDR